MKTIDLPEFINSKAFLFDMTDEKKILARHLYDMNMKRMFTP